MKTLDLQQTVAYSKTPPYRESYVQELQKQFSVSRETEDNLINTFREYSNVIVKATISVFCILQQNAD